MTDREMLELAAMAARLEVEEHTESGCYVFNPNTGTGSNYWAPYINYDDALRLAVKLEMRITIIGDGMCEVSLPDTRDFNPVFEHDVGGDTGKATCRAITRLAAEIGKAMKEAV